jgi:phytoene/squalene synthetase
MFMLGLMYSILAPCLCKESSAFLPPQSNIIIHQSPRTQSSKPNKPTSHSSSTSKEIEQLMSKHDPILLFASRLLPKQKAIDASALYAWCRRLDEITDSDTTQLSIKQQHLIDWQERFVQLYNGNPVDNMDAALYQCLQRHESLTDEPFLDMIAGMKADAVDNRTISTMDELEEYAYQVAGTVGVMLLPLLGDNVTLSKEPAIALGKAIQLINILRDASVDAAMGRIYLPQDMLEAEGVANVDVLGLKSSVGSCNIVEKVSKRAHVLLIEAEMGKSTLPGVGPVFVQIIVELYRGYLVRLEEMGFDNLNIGGERVKVSALQKIMAALRALKDI